MTKSTPYSKRQKFFTVKRVARMAIFTALSVVGAFIKIPSPIGTVAMDSCPGYFSALAWGYREGGIVIALGHLATATSVGFPLGALHVLIAILMSIAAILFRFSATMTPKKWSANLVIAVLVGGTFNGLMALIIAPLIGLGLAIAITPSLLVASYANTIVAAIAYRIVSKAGMV
jgi:uncharacterized membrane protein